MSQAGSDLLTLRASYYLVPRSSVQMKPRPHSAGSPPGGKRDALDDPTEVDPLSEAPTNLLPDTRDHDTDALGPRELPTGPALGSRDLPTGPAANRAPWMRATPGMHDASLEAGRRDPWLLPVFVFVLVLLTCIGVFLYQETHKLP
jgi:hypothetical protein